jgi:hypothetical protein
MKTTTAIIAAVIVAIALFAVLPARAAVAAPTAAPAVEITRVSALNLATNTWATTLSTGDTLQVELRALNGAGAPRVGAISDFVDQGWLPILGYYGYATFTQNGNTYYAHR